MFPVYVRLCLGGVYALEPLPPRWDPVLSSYSLPFYGRARLPSAKNFQMVISTNPSQGDFTHSSSQQETLLQGRGSSSSKNAGEAEETQKEIFFMFGKIEKNSFCLDLRWPVQVIEAFAMAAAALAKKRVVS